MLSPRMTKGTDLATFEYPRLKEGDHSIRIDYDSGRENGLFNLGTFAF